MKHRRILPAMRRSAMQAGLLLIALLGAATIGLPSLRGATITVTTTNDNGAGSLRQALADAADGDTINFASSLNGQMIMLTSGELLVNKSIALLGPGANTLAVDANHASRVFYIASGKDVTIFGLTIRNGTAPSPNFGGGGIYNDHATLTLSNCTISGNSAPVFGEGGGIYNGFATLTLSNCTVIGNSASWGGGGISSTGNSPSAIATLAINNSTFSGNSASWGGGVNNSFAGTLTVTNSTFSGNSAGGPESTAFNGFGGGIYNEQILTMTNSTLSGNSAINHGGGIYTTDPAANGMILKIGNTIFNAGSSGENIYNDATGMVISLGYNLSSDNGGGYLTGIGDHTNTDPKLGPLQDNGGPTFTHLPASDSPVIDAGDPARGMDQRGAGFQRVVNGRIDIGAAEVQTTPTPTPSPTPIPTPTPHKKHH